MPAGDAERSTDLNFDPNDVFEAKIEQACQSRAQAFAQAFHSARAADHRRRAQHLLRPDAGHVPLGAQSDHRRDRLAHHRSRLRRLREPLLGHHRLSAVLDRGIAALRQALRHPRSPRHDAAGDRPVPRGFGGIGRRARHGAVDRRPHAAGDRRWRHRAADANHIADMITPRERGRYQAYMGTSWIVAGVAGPALGGVIAEYLHWSVIFWLNVPFGLIAALLAYHAMKRLPRHERPHQLDIVGAALMIAAATLLLIALTSGGTRVPWISSTIFVLVLASLALSLAFVWWLRLAPEPFLPLTVLRNPVMRAGTAATSWMLGAVLGLSVYMPLYFQVVHKLSATEAGLALIPIVVMTTPGSMLSGRSMMYLRH